MLARVNCLVFAVACACWGQIGKQPIEILHRGGSEAGQAFVRELSQEIRNSSRYHLSSPGRVQEGAFYMEIVTRTYPERRLAVSVVIEFMRSADREKWYHK